MDSLAVMGLLVVAVFLSAFVQTLSGFGFSIVVMPIAVLLLGIQAAAPLVAMLAATLNAVNVVRYRVHVSWREVALLAATASLGVPIGVNGLSRLPAEVMKTGLGIILILYALYILWRPTGVRLSSMRWAVLAGFLSGCLGGAYNTSGPPVIVYGTMRGWSRDRFRSVLQAFFLIVAGQVVLSHFFAHHITLDVQRSYVFLAPVALGGIFVGSRVDTSIPQERFRQLVNVLILLLGLALIF